MSAIVDYELTHFASRGPRFRCWLDGECIIKSSRDPEHECARVLSKRGITGRVQYRRNGVIESSHLIAVAATLTTVEGDKSGLQTTKWQPHFSEAAE